MAEQPATLIVRHRSDDVGTLAVDRQGRLTFQYTPSWLADEQAFPISLSLPLHDPATTDEAGHAFFTNLLPEGLARQAVCNRLGISVDNDFALLRAIGGECAGALSIVEPTARPLDDDHRYERLDPRRLQNLITKPDAVPLLLGGPSTRLSLAGVQDKLPVAMLDGVMQLPLEGAPSTHILKLPNPRFAHLTSNEAYVLGLAARLGLDVAEVELFTRTDPPSLLVKRYDRQPSDDPWPVTRLHQEDLCQALGLPPSRKYEQEGGPTLAAAIKLVRAHVSQPLVDVRRLIEWQAFNVIAGNADGHGKNLSILYSAATARLAPFYDVLSTREYKLLDRHLAMAVGGMRDPDKLERGHWEQLARDAQIGQRVAVELAVELGERCLERISSWTKVFADAHGRQPILQTLPRKIAARARRLVAHGRGSP